MINDKDILSALEKVNYPGFSRNIVSFGLVKSISLDENDVEVLIELATKDPAIPQKIHNDSQESINSIPGIGNVKINLEIKNPPEQVNENGIGQTSLPGVKNIIAVASGKGGVGKSTVAANIAVALSQTDNNLNVGLCDCDLYGPSIPLMFGQESARPMATDENEIIPIEAHGIKLMSMGFLLDDNSPVIVRGPLATRYTQQFLKGCMWGELDYLILDLPPGTGDIQLTIAQSVSVDGAVIVTTPQEMALIDARKATSMFAKVNVPIIGIIENMSYFQCPSDGEKYPIFGEGGGESEAARLGVPLIGQIPIEMPTREAGDSGHPVALGDSITAKEFKNIADKIISSLS